MEVLSESTNDTYYDTFHDEKNKNFSRLALFKYMQKVSTCRCKADKKSKCNRRT